MHVNALLRGVATILLAAGLAVVPATAHAADPGTRSLAEVLTSDGNRFDQNAFDYDIVTEAVLAVVAAKPASNVALLADGTVPLTAFIPNDLSFKKLVLDLTGRWYWSEERTFTALAGAVGLDAIESVLLYHVVPGATIESAAALASDGAVLGTALPGASLTVDVVAPRLPFVQLRDLDRNDFDPFLDGRNLDINKGNRQIAHGIYLVLRPLDL